MTHRTWYEFNELRPPHGLVLAVDDNTLCHTTPLDDVREKDAALDDYAARYSGDPGSTIEVQWELWANDALLARGRKSFTVS